MNKDIERLEKSIDSLQSKVTSETNVLFNQYITSMKDDIEVFDLRDSSHHKIINAVIGHQHFNDIQRGLLLNIMFHLAEKHDTFTQSKILERLGKIMERTIASGTDPELHFRGIVEMIGSVIEERIAEDHISNTKTTEPTTFYGMKLFSYNDGITYEKWSSLFDKYGLPKPQLNAYVSSPYVAAKNGRIMLKPSSFTGTGFGNFIESVFKRHDSNVLLFEVFSDPSVKIELYKDSLDSLLYITKNGETVEHEVEFNPDNVPLSKTFKYSEFVDALGMGFNIPTDNPARTAIFATFSVCLFLEYNIESPNRVRNYKIPTDIKALVKDITETAE